MCTIQYHLYTCGCKKEGRFTQCEPRLGTNVMCDPVTEELMPPKQHWCFDHCVEATETEEEKDETKC
ncbi:hypothetical protein EV127DRAFT_448301 [Xylaria flabelliformis]|nr:hypothetical protein EV127DRAFT_448301 [Xylaria flabelliformis]